MACRLCLTENADSFNMFHGEGISLQVPVIISKHFWFEITEDEKNSPLICPVCWNHLDSFEKFYCEIERVHSGDVDMLLKQEPCQVILTDAPIKHESEEPNHNEPQFDDMLGNFFSCDTLPPPTSDAFVKDTEKIESDDTEQKKVLRSRLTQITLKRSKVPVKKEKELDEKYTVEEAALKNFCISFCDKCQQPFTDLTWDGVKKHYKEQHKIIGYITCCNRKFYKKSKIMEHSARHMNPEAFQCKVCNKNYADNKSLKKHLDIHKPEIERPFPCNECPRRFFKLYLVAEHKKKSHSNEKFPCTQCDKVMSSNASLKAHIRGVHENRFVQICEICARTFRNKINYELHKKETHFDQPSPKVQCEICFAWVKSNSSMRSHMRRHNEMNNIYECNICGRRTPSSASLRQHKNYVHFTERTHKCGICDKSFKKALILKEHMTTHTGEVLYYCSLCPKTFNSGANKHAHFKKMHPVQWAQDNKPKSTFIPP